MKRQIKYFLLVFVVATAALFTGCKDTKKEQDAKIDFAQVQKAMQETNRQCPMQLDYSTVLLSCEALPDHTAKYKYRINAQVADSLLAGYKRVLERKILNSIRYDLSIESLIDNGYSFLHIYLDKKEKELFQIEITPGKYKSWSKENDENKLFTDAEIAEILTDMANINRILLPQRIDRSTVLIDTRYVAPRELESLYNVDGGIFVKDIDPAMLKDVLVDNLFKDPSAKELMNNNVIVKHTYKDEDGKELSILITPEDYN